MQIKKVNSLFKIKPKTFLFRPADPGEEGWIVPEAHDGEAGGLRRPVRYLSRHVHRNQRDRDPHGN